MVALDDASSKNWRMRQCQGIMKMPMELAQQMSNHQVFGHERKVSFAQEGSQQQHIIGSAPFVASPKLTN